MNMIWHIEYLEMTLRLMLAMFLGGVVGWERERSHRAAGFRTHILVCLGSSLIMILSIYGFGPFVDQPNVRVDPARLAAQVISGIGFLGAGAIMVRGLSITGLTTAASLWVVAAVGLAAGAGFYYAAVLVTLLVIVSLVILSQLEMKWFVSKRSHQFEIRMNNEAGALRRVTTELGKMSLHKLSVQQEDGTDSEILITFRTEFSKAQTKMEILQRFMNIHGVIHVKVE